MRTIKTIGATVAADPKRHATEHPLFVVYEWEKIYTEGDADDYAWLTDDDEPSEVDARTAKRLEKAFGRTLEPPDGYKRMGVFKRRRFLTACLTRDGAERFIAANAHRYNGAHVYIESLYRNEEMIAIRQHLMDVAAGKVQP